MTVGTDVVGAAGEGLAGGPGVGAFGGGVADVAAAEAGLDVTEAPETLP